MVPPVNLPSNIEHVAEQVRDFYIRAQRVLNQIMTANGASYARTKMLIFIARGGPLRSTDLADAFGFAPRTVTEAIDTLERDGLIRRDPDPIDRRAKRLSITDAGMAAIQTSEPSRQAFLADIFGTLDDEEKLAFGRTLEKLNRRLVEIEAERAQR